MLVTPEGMVTLVRPLQFKKAPSPMTVTLEGMMVFLHPAIKVFEAVSIIALQLLRESYFLFPASTVIAIKPLQPPKAKPSILITLLGMVTEVKPLQFEYLQLIVHQLVLVETVEKC